jgi:uncharacterized membrane protein
MRSHTIGLLCVSPFFASAASAQFYTMRSPGDSAARNTSLTGLSADGRIAVGTVTEELDFQAFRWTRAGGREDIGAGAGTGTVATGISGDGRVIVGYTQSFPFDNQLPFRWTMGGQFESIPIARGDYGLGLGTNGDGSVVVGALSYDRANVAYAFHWSQAAGMLVPEQDGQEAWCQVAGVSADGSTLVAEHWQFGAFRWTVAGGFDYVHDVDGGSNECLGMSRDASILVGWLPDRSGAMWTPAGTVNLGKLPGTSIFRATDVNDAGTVVVGFSEVGVPASRFIATIWTAERGLEALSDYIAAKGISVPASLDLISGAALSADGRVIGGAATDRGDRNSRIGFVVDLGVLCDADFNGDGFLDFFDYSEFVEAFETGAARGDFNLDGFIDFFDYAEYVGAFETGC